MIKKAAGFLISLDEVVSSRFLKTAPEGFRRDLGIGKQNPWPSTQCRHTCSVVNDRPWRRTVAQLQHMIHETWGYLFHMNHICSIGNLFGVVSSWQEAWGESTVTPCTSYPTYSHPYLTPASFLRVVPLPHQCNNIPFSAMQSPHLLWEFTLGFIYFRGFETAWWHASTE